MSPSFFNPEEVVTVVNYIKQLLEDPNLEVSEDEIGVISPYKRQCQKIRGKLGESSEVMVGTTEEFQGQERRIIILTTVRSNPDYIQQDQLAKIGFLKNKKRLVSHIFFYCKYYINLHPFRFNVAITRAQALLIVVGNPDLLYQVTTAQDTFRLRLLVTVLFISGHPVEAVVGLRSEPGLLQGLSLPQTGGGVRQDRGQVCPSAGGGGKVRGQSGGQRGG